MTKRHRRASAAFMFPPKPKKADNRYGVDVLDLTRDEVFPRYPRDADPGHPWLSPTKSDAVSRSLLIFPELNTTHDPSTGHLVTVSGEDAQDLERTNIGQRPPVNGVGDNDLDLRGFCEDAKLTERQTEVLVLTGEGWSQRAIAEWLKVSQATVWEHLHHGRARLTARLPANVAVRLATA